MAIIERDNDEAFVGQAEADLGGAQEVYDLQGEDRIDDDSESDSGAREPVVDQSAQTFSRHREAVFAVAWSNRADGIVASGGADDRVYLWQAGNASADSSARELAGHTDTVGCLAFSGSGELLASGGLDGQVRIWDPSSGRCLHTLEGPDGGIEWLCWHPLGNIILAGSEDFSTWMWNAQTGIFMQIFTGHSSSVTCGTFTPDGKSIVTGGGSNDASLRMWNPKSGECTSSIQGHGFHGDTGLSSLAVQADVSAVASGSEDGAVCISNLQSGRILGTLQGHTDSVEAMQFSSVLPLLVTGSIDGLVLIWDTATFTLRGSCRHPEGVVRLACHSSLPAVVSGCLDGAVRFWDLRTGACMQTLTGHTEGIQDVAASPDGQHILTGSDDGSAKVFSFRV